MQQNTAAPAPFFPLFRFKSQIMNNSQRPDHNPKQNNNNRTENKDNLDSRKNEEFDFKGNDVTNNKKEHHSESTTVENDGKKSHVS